MTPPTIASVTRCRLCWTVTLAVFLGIVVIEAAILVPSYTNYERDRLESIEFAGLQAVRASLGAQIEGAEPEALSTLLEHTDVQGLRVYHRDEVVAELGETPPADILPMADLRTKRRSGNPDRMWLEWSPDEIGQPNYSVVAALSTASVPEALRAFVFRIIGLVLIIAFFVTIVTMLMLQYLILNPLLQLNARMKAAGEDPYTPESFTLDSARRDELGDVSRAFDRMLLLTRDNLQKIADREARYRELNAELDRRVAERTEALSEANEELQYRACHDELTGLKNRSYFEGEVRRALLERSERQQLAIIMIGLNGFGSINGVYGHQTGDCVLREIARRLESVIPADALLARFGGDVFAIVVQGDRSNIEECAHALAQECCTAVDRPIELDDRTLEVDASAGYATANGPDTTPGAIIGQADLALINAKKDPESTTTAFEPAMNATVEQRMQLIAGLRRGIEHGEFLLHYQPQVDSQGSLLGAEALVRWDRPAEGMVSPADFIPIAEETGLIRPLGSWVLGEAIREAASWANAGYPLRVAVNISARQLRDPQLPAEVSDLLTRYKLQPDLLELEVTESTVLDDLETGACVLDELASLGIQLAIDDFGTGYSSLAYLGQLRAHRLKIDKAFITRLPDNPRDAALCTTIIALAESLGMETLAEGVETPEQVQWLHAHGCRTMQGFHFSKPLPGRDFAELLANDRLIAAH